MLTFPSFRSILTWLDDHIVLLLAGFLIAFIPLYPKIPLFDAIPGYIVRVRLEDIFIFISACIWLVQVVRKKVSINKPVLAVMAAYAVVGLLSVISAVLITKTVPAEMIHIGKTLLHYFRYLEYFSLFAIVYSAIKERRHVLILLSVVVVTVFAITVYGVGQKYFYWPVYSTMNREFSKGLRLYLTEHARVQSTFGGHYDMSAYLVVILPLILALAYQVRRTWLKIALQGVHWFAVWLMIVGASRSSVGAYLLGVAVVILFLAVQKKGIFKKVWWAISRSILYGAALSIMMLYFGEDIYERFLQIIDSVPVAHDVYHGANKMRKQFIADPSSLFSLPRAQKPDNAISTDDLLAIEQGVLVPSDSQPTTQRPTDVYVDVPDIVEVATLSASGAATTILVDKGPRVWSECALQNSLSLCIRLETLWPRAIAGFMRNPVVGSGYATLTKETVIQFTEAESTDNNFLRTLGETGILGFITFYGVIAVGGWYILRHLTDHDLVGRALSIGWLAGTLGLFVNASFIDVFAASKVAMTYWAMLGLIMAYYMVAQRSTATLISREEKIEVTSPAKRVQPPKKTKKAA